MPGIVAAAHYHELEIARRTRPVEHARRLLSNFPLWKLRGAEVYATESPDLSNPGGYYHRGVVIRYKTWCGITRRKYLYFEATAFDEVKQQEVLLCVQRLLAAINTV